MIIKLFFNYLDIHFIFIKIKNQQFYLIQIQLYIIYIFYLFYNYYLFISFNLHIICFISHFI